MGKTIGETRLGDGILTLTKSNHGWFVLRLDTGDKVKIANGGTIGEVIDKLGRVPGIDMLDVRRWLESALKAEFN
jgi:hypothetical protein